MAFIAENLAPIMFAALVIFLLLGYPAAFSLGAVGLMFGVIGIELGLFAPDFLQALPERVYGVMSNDTLLAIPFFTFMGLVLERSGMAEDLLDTIGQLFGTVRGGLAYAVVFVGALLAATTGVVAASVISMGLISLPIMLRYGYDRRVASGIIAASGSLAQIIPPSLVLIVMADQLGRSVGDMYEGAFIPGLFLAGLYALYVFIITVVKPKALPGLPVDVVGFKETKAGPRDLLSRTNGTLLGIGALAALWLLGRHFYAAVKHGDLTAAAASPDITDAIVAYTGYAVEVIVIVALLWSLTRLVQRVRWGGDERGLLSLATLTAIASIFAWYMMRNSTAEGAD